MRYIYQLYTADLAETAESFWDEEAVDRTGMDESFADFFGFWSHEPGHIVGETFWAVLAFLGQTPVGLLVIDKTPEAIFYVSEFVVAPTLRGQGHGTSILTEFLENGDKIIGQLIVKAEAVIFPSNVASQKVFEKSGFRFDHAHPDGDVWYYTYEA